MNLIEQMMKENKQVTKEERKKSKITEAPEELSKSKSVSEVRQDLASIGRAGRGRWVEIDELYTYLKDNNYEIVQALYKDANHNRQSWDFVFKNPEGIYVRYSRFATIGGDTPERLTAMTTMPAGGYSRLQKIPSYDSIHDYRDEPDKVCFNELSKLA